MANPKTELNFEQAIDKLEQIIQDIETNEVDLDTALDQYKYGMELIRFCQGKLRDVEQKIKILDMDTDQLKDFQTE